MFEQGREGQGVVGKGKEDTPSSSLFRRGRGVLVALGGGGLFYIKKDLNKKKKHNKTKKAHT